MRATGDCFYMIKVAETVGLPIYSPGAWRKTVLAQGQGQGRKSPVKAKRLKKKADCATALAAVENRKAEELNCEFVLM